MSGNGGVPLDADVASVIQVYLLAERPESASDGGTVLIYGVTHAEDILPIHPFDVFRREITILGSFAEATSFGATIAALRTRRIRTEGLITHRFTIDDYDKALHALATDPTAHKVIITP